MAEPEKIKVLWDMVTRKGYKQQGPAGKIWLRCEIGVGQRRAKVSASKSCNRMWKHDQIWVKKTSPLISFVTLHMDFTSLNLQGCGEELGTKCESSFSDCNACNTCMYIKGLVTCRFWCWGSGVGPQRFSLSNDADALGPWTTLEKQGAIPLYGAYSYPTAYSIHVPIHVSISKSLNGKGKIRDIKVWGPFTKICLKFLHISHVKSIS